MQAKEIAFKLVSPKDAVEMLQQRNYYFKLTAYRKNFSKKDGKYQNLDFAYLTDLAFIDAQLRYYMMQLCLDLETWA